MNIEGVSAIVTGGASGLGKATAAMLAAYGANVTILDADAEAGRATVEGIRGLFFHSDVTDDSSIESAVSEAEDRNGIARILVNCAGIAPAAKTVDREFAPHSLAVFRKVIEVNLIGSFNVASKVAARMARADALGEERGIIINTASIAAFDGQMGQVAYASSKGGVVGMTLPLARDLAQHLIRVVSIAPGLFWTPMLAGLPPAVQESLGKQAPHPQRLGAPEEYAHLVRAIIENPMLNGETIRLDGAIRMPPR